MPKNENEQELTNYVIHNFDNYQVSSGRPPSNWRRDIVEIVDDHPGRYCGLGCFNGFYTSNTTRFADVPVYDDSGLPLNLNTDPESLKYVKQFFDSFEATEALLS